MSEPAAAGCPSCGAAVNGRFCAACGEQKITERDYSVAHYIGHVFESLTNFDFRTLRAFWTLMARPGRLTRDFLEGRRRIYIGPVQLFVIVNVVFALSGQITFRTPLSTQEGDPPFVALKRSIVADTIARRAVTPEEFRRSFDEAADTQAKTWIFTMIPALGLATAALYGFRRYFFEALIFATHVMAFTLAWMMVAGLLRAAALGVAGVQLSDAGRDTAISAIILVGLAAYLFAAVRRVFGDRPLAAAARSLMLTALFFPIIACYRFLLFFVTLWTMH